MILGLNHFQVLDSLCLRPGHQYCYPRWVRFPPCCPALCVGSGHMTRCKWRLWRDQSSCNWISFLKQKKEDKALQSISNTCIQQSPKGQHHPHAQRKELCSCPGTATLGNHRAGEAEEGSELQSSQQPSEQERCFGWEAVCQHTD